MTAAKPSGWAPVYRVVRRIPEGRVSTYGEIAGLAGLPGAARQVGWALNALDEDHEVPWHRVINAQGRISGRGIREIEDLQRALLESEGVLFNPSGRVDLERYRWLPRKTATAKSAAPKTSQKKIQPRARAGAKL